MLNDFREGGAGRRLTEKENRRLVAQAKRHPQSDAFENLVRAHVGAIVKTTVKFLYRVSPSFTASDLEQEALAAFWKAVRLFKPRRQPPVRFLTYAIWVMRRELGRAADNQAGDIRLPVHRQTRLRKLRAIQAQHLGATGNNLPLTHFASAAGLSVSQVKLILESPRVVVSLDQPVGEKQDETLADILPLAAEVAPAIIPAHALAEVLDVLLSPIQVRVVARHIGLSGRAQTLPEVAKSLRLSPASTLVVWSQALEILRQPENARYLTALVDGE